MMMPANFSAVAENEMTYVVGGGLVDCLAPLMTDKNWQNISLNLIEVVGNAYLNEYMDKAIGNVFSGNYQVGQAFTTFGNGLKAIWKAQDNGQAWGFAKALTNTGLQIVGGLAAIYTLGRGEIGLKYTGAGVKGYIA